MSEHAGRQLVYVIDGGIGEGRIQLGTVKDLAEQLEGEQAGADFTVTEVLALSQLNELKPVPYQVTGAGDFDQDELATAVVTVVFPDGDREWATYLVDGRS